MKIILPGGTGQLGRILTREFTRAGHECVLLTRHPTRPSGPARAVAWDGHTLGPWADELDGAGVVVNLAGRIVDCRYSAANLEELMRSRVDSTRVVGEAIAIARRPPRVWLQASTATIYAHRHDAPNDEHSGRIGGAEPGVPALWQRSVEIGLAWEAALAAARTPDTRRIALRTTMVMSAEKGGAFSAFAGLCRIGLGRHGSGRQFVSWIHEYDFAAAINWLIAHEELDGPINIGAPDPLPNRDFVAAIHRALGSRLAVPIPVWLLEIGAFFRRTETELLLKSRRVTPARLLENGFVFRFPSWPEAARELIARRN
ncbi:MAG: epimerase [Opitutaceae bacterium]